MDRLTLAVVEIFFPTQKLGIEEVQTIEKLLRSDQTIDSLSVYGDKIIFHMTGKDKINYQILDQIKEKLKKMNGANFTISAFEYEKTNKKYYYNSKNHEK